MLNLDKLGAISFTKGCYTGQEVVARTEHLGKSKRRLMRYQADQDGIAVGDKLSDGERDVGTVVNVVGRDLLAVTPVELHDQTLTKGETQVAPLGSAVRIVIGGEFGTNHQAKTRAARIRPSRELPFSCSCRMTHCPRPQRCNATQAGVAQPDSHPYDLCKGAIRSSRRFRVAYAGTTARRGWRVSW